MAGCHRTRRNFPCCPRSAFAAPHGRIRRDSANRRSGCLPFSSSRGIDERRDALHQPRTRRIQPDALHHPHGLPKAVFFAVVLRLRQRAPAQSVVPHFPYFREPVSDQHTFLVRITPEDRCACREVSPPFYSSALRREYQSIFALQDISAAGPFFIAAARGLKPGRARAANI